VFRVCLLNMPFADLLMPSIALTQLKSVTDSCLAGRVNVEIVDVNHDFAQHIGVDVYRDISGSMKPLYAGFGDWYFRQAAFPFMEDNRESYFKRFLWSNDESTARFRRLVDFRRPLLHNYIDSLITRYKLADAQLVGFTSMFMQTVPSIAVARRLKELNPTIITVLGGANCEYPMGSVLAANLSCIDYIFSGPALKSFPQLLQNLLEGDDSKSDFIPGVLNQQNAMSKGISECYGEELDIDVPIPLNYDEFIDRFEVVYAGRGMKPALPFETSLGCWWGQRSHCTFCGLNSTSMAYRAMSSKPAIDQFNSLFRYAGRVSTLQAVDNILPKNYLTEVLPFIDTPKEVKIFYEVKADLSEEQLTILARAGVTSIQPGIESIATSTLKLMKKGTTSYQNVKFLKNCSFLKINPSWNLLVGFPGEDPEVYLRYTEIIPLLMHLYPPSGVFPIRYDRFSPYFKRADEYNLELRPMDFYSYVYPFSEKDIAEFAYYFVDTNVMAEYQLVMFESLDALTVLVNKWKSRWHKDATSVKPRLYLKENSSVIYDSRAEDVKEYILTVDEVEILRSLDSPLTIEELVRRVSYGSGTNPVSVVNALESKGLLFREGQRVLSLVMRKDPDNYFLPDVSPVPSGVSTQGPFAIFQEAD
jgi:ribosomal peptide maturation radical SAM protein 1